MEPGFANIRVSPRARKTSIAASRTVAGAIRATLSDDSARVRRVRLLALARRAGEDLCDHAEVAVGREVRERIPAEVAAEQDAVPALRLRRDGLVEVRRRDADVVHALTPFGEEPRVDAPVVERLDELPLDRPTWLIARRQERSTGFPSSRMFATFPGLNS